MRRTLKNIGIADLRSSHSPGKGLPTPRAEPQPLLEREALVASWMAENSQCCSLQQLPSLGAGAALQREGILWRYSTMKIPKGEGWFLRSFWLLGTVGHSALQKLGSGTWSWRS